MVKWRFSKVALVPLVLASLALAGDGSAKSRMPSTARSGQENPRDKEYSNPNNAVWDFYGKMYFNMGIAEITCPKDSKHYDPELCEEAAENVTKYTFKYIETLRKLERRIPSSRRNR